MKALLLMGGLLLGGLGAQAQPTNPLPVDSALGKVVYRGSVDVSGMTAMALRRRAVEYTAGFFFRDTVQLLTGANDQREGRYTVRYRVTIWPATAHYRYELSILALTYPVRVGEGFIAGKISPITTEQSILIDQLRTGATRPLSDISDWQVAVAQVAQRVIAQVETTMLGK